MVVIEIPPNPNCDAVEMRLFHPVEAPRHVRRVRVEHAPGQPEWLEVTGWNTDGSSCAALAQPVDDSGDGLALLVHGGSAGLRLRRVGEPGPWRLGDAAQWGLPFLLTGDRDDIQCTEGAG